jgi:prevent-host-death family protein
MRTIPAGEFKAKCLAIMDEVQAGGESVIITKRGKPVVRITSLENPATGSSERDSIFGFMKGGGTVVGDIVAPILPDSSWSHLQDEDESRATK